MNKYLNHFFSLLGMIFILLGIMAIIESFISKNPLQILWFCYPCLILIGIGIFRKNTYLIISQLNILLIPIIIWNIDFFSIVFINRTIFGITDYLFQGKTAIISLIITSQHLFIIPISLLTIYFKKTKNKTPWKLSIIQITLFFIIIRLFTPIAMNINYAFYPFSPIDKIIQPQYYSTFWFLIFFIMIFISNFLLTKLGNLNKNA